MPTLLRIVAVVAAIALLTACPRAKRRTLVPDVPSGGDVTARDRFMEARERFLRDGTGAEEFAAIAEEYPDDPVAPFAHLYAGIASVDAGDHRAAVDSLRAAIAAPGAPAGLITRAELFLGIALNATGDHAGARPLLARGEPAIENDAERGEWLAASAVAATMAAPAEAPAWLERWWPVATEAERGWILANLEAITASLEAAGDPGAAAAGATLGRLRGQLGATAATGGAAPGPGDAATPGQIGAILPLDGKQSRVADAAARGLAIAAGAHGGAAAVTVDVADAAGAEASAQAVTRLADGGAIAIVGPIDGASTDGAARRADELGVPLVSLDPRPEARAGDGPHVFHAMHSAEQRATILARRAGALGIDRFAILAPDSGYGRAVAAAFEEQVAAQGGRVVVRVDYPAGEKSFTKVVKKLTGSWEAVFVPDQAARLELIAPSLAAAGLVPRAHGGKVAKKQGRAIVLLSTAEGLGPEYLRAAGRHTIGALLAPGFYPDRADPTIAAFVDRYEQAYGRPPTAIDAYAHDAALAIAVAAGRLGSRAAVAQYLAKVEVDGATGAVRFGADRRRADDGVLFTVEDDGATVRTLR